MRTCFLLFLERELIAIVLETVAFTLLHLVCLCLLYCSARYALRPNLLVRLVLSVYFETWVHYASSSRRIARPSPLTAI